MAEDADAKLNRLVLHLFREDEADVAGHVDHLRACPDAYAVDTDGGDGSYGCETGCSYVRLEAVVRCPHGCTADVEYGGFGDMESLYDAMDRA